MQINSIGNEPSFGVRYKNKRLWDKETLKTFENSKLLKEINEKYPDATVNLREYSNNNGLDTWYTMFLEIALTPQKIYKWGLASIDPFSPNIRLAEDLETLTLSQVEKNAAINNSVKNNKLKFLSVMSEKFSKIFSKQ